MAEIAKLVPRLKYSVKPRHRNLKNLDGPLGRINKMRKTVTALFKYERLELYQPRCEEARGYAERVFKHVFFLIRMHIFFIYVFYSLFNKKYSFKS